jgi:hypothetical protein
MRILLAAALLVALAAAGCTAGPEGAEDPEARPPVPPTQPGEAGDAPPNGLCGPPECSPCPEQHFLNADPAADAEGREVVAWDDVPPENRTKVLEDLLLQAAAGTSAQHEASLEEVRRQLRHLKDAHDAASGDDRGDDDLDPIVVVHGGRLVRFSVSSVVC